MPLKVSQAVWRGCLLSHSRSIWKHWHLVTVWSEMTTEKSWRAGGVSMPLQGLEILKRLLHLLPFFTCLLHHSPFGGPAAASVSRFTWPLEVFKPWVCAHLAAGSQLPCKQRCDSLNLATASVALMWGQSHCHPLLTPTASSVSCRPFPIRWWPPGLCGHTLHCLPHTWAPTGAVKVTDPLPKHGTENDSSPTSIKHLVSQKTGFSLFKTTSAGNIWLMLPVVQEWGRAVVCVAATLPKLSSWLKGPIGWLPSKPNQREKFCQRNHTKSLAWTKPSASPRFHPVFRSLIFLECCLFMKNK